MLAAGAGRERGERGGRGRVGGAVVVAEPVRDAQDPGVRPGGSGAARRGAAGRRARRVCALSHGAHSSRGGAAGPGGRDLAPGLARGPRKIPLRPLRPGRPNQLRTYFAI